VNEELLLSVTDQTSIDDALEWIADGFPLELDADVRAVIRSVMAVSGDELLKQKAIRSLVRRISVSELDSAKILFDVDELLDPDDVRMSLLRLATLCQSGGLDSLSAREVVSAQRVDPSTIEVLCTVAAITYKELTERVHDLPSSAHGPFSPSQIRNAFAELDRIISGSAVTALPGAVPARPLELMNESAVVSQGWRKVEEYRSNGVPYEVLLAQRESGGAWLAHRNRTSGRLAPLLAERLCREIDYLGLAYLRSSIVGGTLSPLVVAKESGCDQQVSMIVLDRHKSPAFGIIFSTARDGGTARANASRLRKVHQSGRFPIAILIAGPGWSKRLDTADLAVAFSGRIYTENAISDLVKEIVQHVQGESMKETDHGDNR